MSTWASFTIEQDGQKVEGPCPQSEKWRPTGPLAPISAAYAKTTIIKKVTYIALLTLTDETSSLNL